MKRRLLLSAALLIATFTPAHAGEGKKVDLPAPEVSGPNQDGTTVNFAEVYKKGPTVVFFYPKANTPGCTKQACSLRDAYADLTKQGVQVLGVSFDKPDDQKKFRDDFKLPYDLIADPQGTIVDAFKVVRKPRGDSSIASREAFLVKDGRIVWHDATAATTEQAADILRVLKP